MLSFKPLSRGHVLGLGSDWTLRHPQAQQQEQQQGAESYLGSCHLSWGEQSEWRVRVAL